MATERVTRPRIRYVRADDYVPPPPLDERPCCGYCHERLRPLIDREIIFAPHREGGYTSEELEGQTRRLNHGWRSHRWRSYGHFCTQRCATRFANAAYKAGYRMKVQQSQEAHP